MDSLINKNDLYKKCENLHKRFVEGKITGEEAFRDLFNAVADAPPVTDVKTIIHGHWIQSEFISVLGKCSVCNNPIDDTSNYCQWCGAKMDGESK